MLSIVIVDSIKSNARQLESIIKNTVNENVRMKYVSNSAEVFDYLKLVSGNVNMAFIDISAFDETDNGIDTAVRLNKEYPEVKVVFTSSSISDHIEDMFVATVFGCLIKPYVGDKPTDRTAEAIRRIINKYNELNVGLVRDYVAVEVRGRTKKVALSDIVLIESDKRKINIILNNGSMIDMYMKLDEFCQKLPESTFIRCHKSYCVNANYVASMSNDSFSLLNGEAVPISRASQPVVKKQYIAFFGEKLY